jgi:hypothetical protein
MMLPPAHFARDHNDFGAREQRDTRNCENARKRDLDRTPEAIGDKSSLHCLRAMRYAGIRDRHVVEDFQCSVFGSAARLRSAW